MAIKTVNGVDVFYLTSAEQDEFDKKEEDRKKLLKWQEKRKGNDKGAIYTINYFGAKKAWFREYEALYKYVTNMGCSILVDAFGGSGFLSLLASKTGLFEQIYLNELSYLTINYHYVMKNDKSINTKDRQLLFKMRYNDVDRDRNLFEEFIYYLDELDEPEFIHLSNSYRRFAFRTVEKNVVAKNNKVKISYWVPQRIQVRKASVKRAVLFYMFQYYNFRGSGNYDRSKTYPPYYYVERLKETHLLYDKIELSQLYYKKFINKYLSNPKAIILLDPPYLKKTRVKKQSYVCEMTEREHRYLLEELTIKNVIQAKVVLCGYQSTLYDGYFLRANQKGQHWHSVKINRLGRRKKNQVNEYWWVNFDITTLVNQYPNLFELIY